MTFEEGTSAAWLYDLLKPHVANVMGLRPGKNALLKVGNKNDRIDARKLTELLRGISLTDLPWRELGADVEGVGPDLSDYHERSDASDEPDQRRVSKLGDSLRWSSGVSTTPPRAMAGQIAEPGVRRRAERLYQQLDELVPLRQGARRELLAESRKHQAVKLLRQIPYLGPIRSALLVALLGTPHRFRTKRQFGPIADGLRLMTAANTAL